MRILQNTATRPVAGVSFCHEGRTLVAGGSGGFDIWDLTTSRNHFIPSHNTKYIYACVCDPGGRWFYFSDSVGGCRLIDLNGEGERRLPGTQHDHHVVSLATTTDGTRLIVTRGGAMLNRVECWDIESAGAMRLNWALRSGQPMTTVDVVAFEQNSWFTNAVAVDVTGDLAAMGEQRHGGQPQSQETVLAVRDANDGHLVQEMRPFQNSVGLSLAFTPSGSRILASTAREIEVWDRLTGTVIHKILPPGRAHFQALAVHPSGHAAAVARDGKVRFWDLATCRLTRTLDWQVGPLNSLAFSPDGSLAAASADKGRVVVWDVDL